LKADVLTEFTASTSLVDRVAGQVTAMIRRGELQPDAQVNINALAKRWSISLVPIREALARLSATGLLQFVPNRGYRVAPRLTKEERLALFEAREFLEVTAAKLAAKHRTDAQIDALKQLNEKMRALPSKSTEASSYAFFTLNDEFHKSYVRMSSNAYLIKWFEALSFDALVSRETGTEFDIERLVGEHEQIIHAIAERKAATIRDLLKKHIRSTRYSLP
jgi:DNA-binding GntR family transcriptional regulator